VTSLLDAVSRQSRAAALVYIRRVKVAMEVLLIVGDTSNREFGQATAITVSMLPPHLPHSPYRMMLYSNYYRR
jgi:hypothetical protein